MDDLPLLMPGNLGGRAGQFYHFLLGYFLPVAQWLRTNQVKDFEVQDVGPLTAYFEVLRAHANITVSASLGKSHLVDDRSSAARGIQLPGWDASHAYRLDKINSARTLILSSDTQQQASRAPLITVLDRGKPHPWYATQGQISANQTRSLPNASDIADHLTQCGVVRLVDPAELDAARQINLFSRTDVLVGQHGAALANMVWMRPGTAVVEISPPVRFIGRLNGMLFRDLAACLGHSYSRVDQDNPHANVNPNLVLRALELSSEPTPESSLERQRRVVVGRAVFDASQMKLKVKQIRSQIST